MECFNILLKIGNSLPTIFTLKQLSQFLSPKNFGIKIIPALMSQEVRIVHIKHQRLTIGTWQQQVPPHNSEQHCPNLGLASSLVSGVLPSFACTLGK